MSTLEEVSHLLGLLGLLPRWLVTGTLVFVFGYACGQVNASREYVRRERQAEARAKAALQHRERAPARAPGASAPAE